MPQPKILYTSFDHVPAPKGASTHILAFVKALGIAYQTPEPDAPQQANVVLVTPAEKDIPIHLLAPGVRHLQFGCAGNNPLERASIFRRKLSHLLEHQAFNVIHFRSIFEGVVALDPKLNRGARLIYEANGFPSIEMKVHYRQLNHAGRLIEKLKCQEQHCLEQAHQILTVSQVTQQYIQNRVPSPPPIDVIPNGYDPAQIEGQPPPEQDHKIRILYFGTLAPWQGIETLLEAVAAAHRQRPCHLTLAGPCSQRRQRELDATIHRLKMAPIVQQKTLASSNEIAHLLHQSDMTIVPLLPTERNTIQGCCPIKMIESMASGCPIIASNLPVIQELGRPDIDYLPARPGDARNLKNRILRLADDRRLAHSLSRHARQRAQNHFTWQHATDKLLHIYQTLLHSPPNPT